MTASDEIQRSRPLQPSSTDHPSSRDDNTSTQRTPSEQESDSGDDEFLNNDFQSPLDIRKQDRAVLDEEDENEKLLTKESGGSSSGLRRFFGNVSRGDKREGDYGHYAGNKNKEGYDGEEGNMRERRELVFAMDGYDDDDSEEIEGNFPEHDYGYDNDEGNFRRKYGTRTPLLELGDYYSPRVCFSPFLFFFFFLLPSS